MLHYTIYKEKAIPILYLLHNVKAESAKRKKKLFAKKLILSLLRFRIFHKFHSACVKEPNKRTKVTEMMIEA